MKELKGIFYINGRNSSFNSSGKLAQESVQLASAPGNGNLSTTINGNLTILSNATIDAPAGMYMVTLRPATPEEVKAVNPEQQQAI